MKRYIRTTLLGGIAAVLPLALVIMVFRWIIGLIEKYLGPIVALFTTDSKFLPVAIYAILIAALLVLFFFIGVIVKTRIGNFLRIVVEKNLLKIPGYRIARETVKQFFGKHKSFFSQVVLVNPFNTGTLQTGFITEDQGEFLTVFVPTGPNPTSGLIYHLSRDQVLYTETTVENGMKTIFSCGARSSEIFSSAEADPGKWKSGKY